MRRAVYGQRRSVLLIPRIAAQCRFYEHWGMGVGPRMQKYMQGDKLPQTYNDVVQTKVNVDSQSLTGNSALPCYDMEMLHDVGAESAYLKNNEWIYPHSRHYIVPQVNPDLCERVGKMFMGLSPEERENIWKALILDYPNLSLILDQPKKDELFNLFYQITTRPDDKEAAKLATPVVLKFYEKHYISWSYWFRIAEKIMETFQAHPEAKRFERRTLRLSVERAAKICLNCIADQPWANETFSSPYTFDVCGERMWHDTGHW